MFIHQWIKYIALTHPAMQNTKNFKYPVLYVMNFQQQIHSEIKCVTSTTTCKINHDGSEL